MKSNGASGARRRDAYTLVQSLVVMAILLIVVLAVLSSHVFGLRLMEVTQTQLGASDAARRGLSGMAEELRSAKTVDVGSGNAKTFAEPGFGQRLEGNAAQVYATADTNVYVRYFLDTNSGTLNRLASGSQTPTVVVSGVSNATAFALQDISGTVLSNRQAHLVLALVLQFNQLQNPKVAIGKNNYFTSYQYHDRFFLRASD